MKRINKAKLNSLAHAFEEMSDLQGQAARLIREAFPVGCKVQYQHGDRLRTVKVVEHRKYNHLDLWVEGVTGARYRIGVWLILRAMVEGFEG